MRKKIILLILLINCFGHSKICAIEDIVITADGKQLLGELKNIPSLKYSFGDMKFNDKNIYFIVNQYKSNKLQYITTEGYCYMASCAEEPLNIEGRDGKIELSTIAAIFHHNKMDFPEVAENSLYSISFDNGDKITAKITNSIINIQTDEGLDVIIPTTNQQLKLSWSDIAAIQKIDLQNHQEILEEMTRVLQSFMLMDSEITKVGLTRDEILQQRNTLSQEAMTAVGVVEEKSKDIACALDPYLNKEIPQLFAMHQDFKIPAGIHFLEKPTDDLLAYEDLDNVEISFDDVEEEEEVASDYTFISNQSLLLRKSGILAFDEGRTVQLISQKAPIAASALTDTNPPPSILMNIKELTKGKILVTNKEYKKFLESTHKEEQFSNIESVEDNPVIDVSLPDAQKYAEWKKKTLMIPKSEISGATKGLLSETEDRVEWIPIPENSIS